MKKLSVTDNCVFVMHFYVFLNCLLLYCHYCTANLSHLMPVLKQYQFMSDNKLGFFILENQVSHDPTQSIWPVEKTSLGLFYTKYKEADTHNGICSKLGIYTRPQLVLAQ